jgi:hypothetical protein
LAFVFGANKWVPLIVGPEYTKRPEIMMFPGVEVWTWKPAKVPPDSGDDSPRATGWKAGEFLVRYLHGAGFFMSSHFEVSSTQIERFAPFGFNPSENRVVVFVGIHNIDWDVAILKQNRANKQ